MWFFLNITYVGYYKRQIKLKNLFSVHPFLWNIWIYKIKRYTNLHLKGQVFSASEYFQAPEAPYKRHVTSQSESNTTATYMLFPQLFSVSKRGIWNI